MKQTFYPNLRFTTTFFIFIACLSSAFAQFEVDQVVSQELISDAQPKVGLVLSGGAAHGLAHIGVIQYMEELGIPVDYITGTSMGSIVGGLLAMGYDAKGMTELASEIDWDPIMTNTTPLYEIAPLEKSYHDKFPLLFKFENRKVLLPRGILGGQHLDMLLARIYSPAHFVDDFDKLQIPFRCFAVDIETGEVLTLDSGYLGQAIRASMAIPMIFSPTERDGRLLVDGGLIRNFPVEDNISMGADFIVGVYVGSEKATIEEMPSSIDILRQSTKLMGIFDSERQKELCDILIEPNVKDFEILDLTNYKAIIEEGYLAARKQNKKFLQLKERILSSKPRVQKLMPMPQKIFINKIKMAYGNSPMKDLVLNRCGMTPMSYINLDDIEHGLIGVYGTKNFENVSYSFTNSEDGMGLELFAKPLKQVSVAANFNHFASSNSSLILYAEVRNKIAVPSRLVLASRLSENPGFLIDYHRRVGDAKNFYYKSSIRYEKYELPLFAEGSLRRLYNTRSWNTSVGIGMEYNNNIKIESNVSFLSEHIKPIVNQTIDIIKYHQEQLRINFAVNHNSLDKNSYPDEGLFADLSLNFNLFRNVTDQYTNAEALSLLKTEEDNITSTLNISLKKVFPLKPHVSTISSAYFFYRFGSSLQDNLSIGGTEQTRLGAVPFIGISEGGIIFKNGMVFRQELRFNPLNKVYFSFIANVAFGQTALDVLLANQSQFNNRALGLGINIGVDTPLGPVDLNLGFEASGPENASLGAGYRYIF